MKIKKAAAICICLAVFLCACNGNGDSELSSGATSMYPAVSYGMRVAAPV